MHRLRYRGLYIESVTIGKTNNYASAVTFSCGSVPESEEGVVVKNNWLMFPL